MLIYLILFLGNQTWVRKLWSFVSNRESTLKMKEKKRNCLITVAPTLVYCIHTYVSSSLGCRCLLCERSENWFWFPSVIYLLLLMFDCFILIIYIYMYVEVYFGEVAKFQILGVMFTCVCVCAFFPCRTCVSNKVDPYWSFQSVTWSFRFPSRQGINLQLGWWSKNQMLIFVFELQSSNLTRLVVEFCVIWSVSVWLFINF